MLYLRPRLFLLVALVAAVPISLYAQQPPRQQPPQLQESRANSRYILFIHTGGGPENLVGNLVQNVLTALLKEGYSVRKPDNQRDAVGGPGVDYFDDEDGRKAQEVADIVNSILPSTLRRLEARRQRAKNPPGYLGVWLF